MRAIEILQKQWREEGRFRRFRPSLHIDDDGLSLGAGTFIAPMVTKGGAPGLALDGRDEKILALLSLGFRRPIPITALKFIRRASMQWARGDKVLAHFELAYARLPRFDARDEARHLFYADGFLRLGLPPRVLMSAHGLDTSQLDLLKAGYNPYQPRVPAGRGRTSGQWASANGQPAQSTSTGAADAQSVPPPSSPHVEPEQSADVPHAHAGSSPRQSSAHQEGPRPWPKQDAGAARATSSDQFDSNVVPEVPAEIPASPEEQLDANEGQSARNTDAFPVEPPKSGGRLGSAALVEESDPIGIGRHAGESIPARSPAWNFTVKERQEINRIGSATGCHSCGTKDPGTATGNFIPDHQPPSSLNPPGNPQRLYPHCVRCSARQGSATSRRPKGEP